MDTNHVKTYLMTALTLVATCAVGFVPTATAEEGQCNNNGVQIVAGDYNCRAQYCDNRSGAGAGAGSGGPGENDASAGASAGIECNQESTRNEPERCGDELCIAYRVLDTAFAISWGVVSIAGATAQVPECGIVMLATPTDPLPWVTKPGLPTCNA